MPAETFKETLTRIEALVGSVIERVATVERIMGYDSPPIEDIEKGSDRDQRLSKAKFARREGISERSLDRERKRDPNFPRGELDNGRWFFWLSDVKRYEREKFEAQLGRKAHDPSRYLPRNKASTESAAS
jgi:hypothetical protein